MSQQSGRFTVPNEMTNLPMMAEKFALPAISRAGLTRKSKVRRNPVDIIGAVGFEQLCDEELVVRYRAASGAEADAYINELFRRYYVQIARWCWRFSGEREAAADLAQEVCSTAYQNLSQFRGDSKFSTWLFTIARNRCLNAMRARGRQATELRADDPDDNLLNTLPDGREDQYTLMKRQTTATAVRDLLNDTLDKTEKAVFTLHYAEELPLDAITRMMSLDNLSGAKAYIVSAKRKLARALATGKMRKVGSLD